MPLRTPGRIRTRLLSSPGEDSEISAEERTPGIQAPDTPEVDMNFSVDPESYTEWTEGGLPTSLISTIQSMEQGFEKANGAILGLHRDFSSMGAVLADDVHALDCRLERVQTTVGPPKSVTGAVGGNVWEVLAQVGGNLDNFFGTSAAPVDIQERLGSLAAAVTVSKQELSALRVEKNSLVNSVLWLESQLTATLEIVMDLRTRLDGQDSLRVPAATGPLREANPVQTSRDVRVVIDGINRPQQLNTGTDGLSRGEFSSTIEHLRSELRLIKK